LEVALTPGRGSASAVPVLWLTAGLGCDGDSIAMTAATQPSIEDLVGGVLPGVPPLELHHPILSYETGDDFLATFHAAANGDLGPFILVVEGSIPNENLSGEGYWAAMGNDPVTGEPITTCTWIDRLAPHAWAILAIGTCAAYGGIHAVDGNPTGAMGLSDYLGWDWRSPSGLPIVNLGGCPVRPDNATWTLLQLLRQYAGDGYLALDSERRPLQLFDHTVHEGCDRGGFYEQGDFAGEYGSSRCIVKLGCWGPVVDCNVAKSGWMNGVGGCANVGGICNGCTMPGWPDKFLPFMDEPAGAKMSTSAVLLYGRTVRALRDITRRSMNLEPEWRRVKFSPRGGTGADE
jgi:hydrogenase small subunit